MTSPLLLVAVLLSAGAAYAALLKYAETRLIVAGMFTVAIYDLSFLLVKY